MNNRSLFAGSSVTLTVASDADAFVVTVADTGEGMTPEVLARRTTDYRAFPLRSSRMVRQAWVQFDSIEVLASNSGAIRMPENVARVLGIVAAGKVQKSGGKANTVRPELGIMPTATDSVTDRLLNLEGAKSAPKRE